MASMRDVFYFIMTAIAICLFAVAFDQHQQVFAATPAEPDVTCATWASTNEWTVTRCEDEYSGEICFLSSSGMMQCRFE